MTKVALRNEKNMLFGDFFLTINQFKQKNDFLFKENVSIYLLILPKKYIFANEQR